MAPRDPNPDPDPGSTQEGTLIPEHIVDQASQRLFVVSIFVLIQSWKIYDILMIRANDYNVSVDGTHPDFTSLNNFTFVMKYALVDGLFLWLLPVLNIPLLSFQPLVTLLLTVAVNILTFVLASNSALPFLSSIFVPVWNSVFKDKELTLIGDSVTPQSVIDINSHFKGKYTIQYLPASSVTLNPFHMDNVCLEEPHSKMSTFPSSIRLPIEFNTTTDIGFMQIQHISPSNTLSLLNFTSHDIQKLMRRDYSYLTKNPGYVSSDERVFYLDIDVSKPGKYRIGSVVDTDGMSIRPYKSDFVISHCPSAKFVYPGIELTYSEYKCVGKSTGDVDWVLPLISSFGVSPVIIELTASLDGRVVKTFNTTISGEPNVGGMLWLKADHISRNSLEQEVLRNPSLFQQNRAGKFEFHVLRVSDSLGNSRDYNPVSKDKEVNFAVNLRKTVELKLVDRHPDSPLLVNSSKTLHLEAKQQLVLPLTVTLSFEDPQDPLASFEKVYTFNEAVDYSNGFEVTRPGIYSIISGNDKYCPCDVEGKENLDIRAPLPPTVLIEGEPIADKCVGTVGFEFDVTFTGNAPFQILYQVFKNSSGVLRPVLNERGLRDHTKQSMDKHYLFQYKPRQEGNYVLVFKEVKDINYNKQPVAIDEAANTFLTYFHQRSRYSFFKDTHETSKQYNVCKGGKVDLPVHFEGNFPFSFQYEIRDRATGNVVVSEEIKDNFQNSYELHTPSFDKGGDFEVVLNKVVDKLGCPVDTAKSETIIIKARREVPEVQFSKEKTHYIVEGDYVQIPLSFKTSVGSSQKDRIDFTVEDLHNSSSKKIYSIRGSTVLRAKANGVYRLVSYESNECPGSISNDLAVTVLYYPKPKLTIVPEEKDLLRQEDSSILMKPLCQNAPRTVKLKLEGKKPFIVNYKIRYPSGIEKSSFMSIDKDEVVVPLPTQQEGKYEHYFTGIFDALYTQEKIAHVANKQETTVLRYDIQGSPSLKIDKSESYVQLCETRVKKDLSVKIPVALDGRYPFNIKGSIRNAHSDKIQEFVVENLVEPTIDIGGLDLLNSKELPAVLTVGEHLVVFEEITDANQCQQKKLTSHNTILISITKVPSITKQSQKQYYCVGDQIAYNMSGISPFVVYYKFNEQTRRAELGSDFHRLASKPGDLAIIALQDSSASQCLVNFTHNTEEYDQLKLQVHDLPSVEISHGDSMIKNLHEGDQTEITFKFSGVPPFQITYVRTLGEEEGRHKRRQVKAAQRKPRRVVETKTVEDIWDYEYSEVVSLEGTYEAIRVADAYCSASRDVNDIL